MINELTLEQKQERAKAKQVLPDISPPSMFSPLHRPVIKDESDPTIGKEALNFPIQSSAASIINQAMIRIDARLEGSDMIINQIHDALLFECDDSRVGALVSMITEEMERPVSFRGTYRSFPVEVSTGPSWGELSSA